MIYDYLRSIPSRQKKIKSINKRQIKVHNIFVANMHIEFMNLWAKPNIQMPIQPKKQDDQRPTKTEKGLQPRNPTNKIILTSCTLHPIMFINIESRKEERRHQQQKYSINIKPFFRRYLNPIIAKNAHKNMGYVDLIDWTQDTSYPKNDVRIKTTNLWAAFLNMSHSYGTRKSGKKNQLSAKFTWTHKSFLA